MKIAKIYENLMFSVFEKNIKINNKTSKLYLIKKRAVVVILPILNNKKIILEKQYRLPADKVLYEIPAGNMEDKETPIVAARRELKEETGYTAKSIKKVYEFYSSPGIFNEVMHFFVATGLTPGKTHFDEDEDIKLEVVSFQKAVKMLKEGKIKDAKTIIAILYLHSLLKK